MVGIVRISRQLATNHGLAVVHLKRAVVLRLPFAERAKSRLRCELEDGTEVAIVLEPGSVMRGGTILISDDGRLVRVEAAPQDVLDVTSENLHTLARAAYHLGNRHVPVQVGESYLRLEADHVLEDMLRRLGAHVQRAWLPFEPESGAYGGGHRHGHDATFGEDHALVQAAFAAHHCPSPAGSDAPGDGDDRASSAVHHHQDHDHHGN